MARGAIAIGCGEKTLITSARPPNAPKLKPPPRYLPSVVRSGAMPSSPCRPAGPRRDVMTSSKMSGTSCASHSSRNRPRNSGVPGMHPALPRSGSTIAHPSGAVPAACAANGASREAASLKSARW